MRSDMDKVIVERPRTGGDGGKSIPIKGYKKRVQRDLREGDLPTKEGMTLRYGGRTKSLNEHLQPLYNFLRSRVGHRWDSVYSEICKNLRISSAVQSHVRDHVDRDVEKNVVMIDGVPYTSDGKKIYREFYVWKGILRYLPYKKGHWRKKTPSYVEKDSTHQYHLVNGFWFEVELAPFPPRFKKTRTVIRFGISLVEEYWTGDSVHDVILGTIIYRSREQCLQKYGRSVYAVKKRSLGKKEIKRLKLWDRK